MSDALSQLATASRRYGADPQFVFGGGGNTSWKTADKLYIKPSGVSLATIQPEQFVKMERAAIRAFFEVPTPADPDEREVLVKNAMAAAVCADSQGRPSVEAPVHELFPQQFVIHTHSILVNGMTCAKDGEAACKRLLPEALWVPYIDPGYTLARELERMMAAYEKEHGSAPQVLILKNHGIFVAADSINEIDALYRSVIDTLLGAYKAAKVETNFHRPAANPAAARAVAPALRSRLGSATARATVHAGPAFTPAPGALTPDHIVYAKSYPFTGTPTVEALRDFQVKHGYTPIIVATEGGTFAVEKNLKSARLAMEAAWNAHCVQGLTAAFGGPRYLDDRERGFIENWEVESYRKKLSAGGEGKKRLEGRVALITGAAQGFGWGIAQGMAAAGATIVVADLNADGAAAAANTLCEEFGEACAFSVAVNVSDEASVAAMIASVVTEAGGLDVLVSNAGVLRAASVKTFELKDWKFVTDVNYTGYFLCTKHCAQVMAEQNIDGLGPMMDVIQLNSKSGLAGSNKNAAYAGGKFGGIGLTQSFALELIEDRIKVNAVCPGNFLDGPLWCDPERGLFVQYLKTGKVPGAKSIEDVKKFYEGKVPMGRGCLPEDVTRAIIYAIEQTYETGQAIPVTGGQIMLA